MLAALLLVLAAPPQIPPEVVLWPDGAPGAVGTEEADTPAIFIYPAHEKEQTGAAVVLCPGGGYAVHAMDHEGHQVARWFQRNGVTCALLRYRLGERYRHPAPLHDVRRAIRHVRANAADLDVDPRRIGVMGFSAGGHLASTAATMFEAGDETSDDPVDRVSSRPDFAVLCYPVISMSESFRHAGSAHRLLGPDASDEQLAELSTDRRVTADTPPTFLFHTVEDTGVPVQNSLAFFSSLLAHGVPCELHAFETGPHGVGMAPGDPNLKVWPDLLLRWMERSGFLTGMDRVAVSGTVTVDGRQIVSGDIHFTGGGLTAYGRISRGRFSIGESRGVAPGINVIRITDLGGVKPGPTVEAAKSYFEKVDVIPEEPLDIELSDKAEVEFN